MTGGNTGIGYTTALALLQNNAKVYLACRTESRARDAIARLQKKLKEEGKPDPQVEFLELELANLKKSREAAQHFLQLEQRLDILSTSLPSS